MRFSHLTHPLIVFPALPLVAKLNETGMWSVPLAKPYTVSFP